MHSSLDLISVEWKVGITVILNSTKKSVGQSNIIVAIINANSEISSVEVDLISDLSVTVLLKQITVI